VTGSTRGHGEAFGIRRLTLAHFRTYERLSLETEAGGVILTGQNGIGKTNILEALSLLSSGKGLRRAATASLARLVAGQPSGPWAVGVRLATEDGDHQIGIGQDGDHPGRRHIRVDGTAGTHGELSRFCRFTWLTPAQDRVFVGSRGERLRFFDRLALALFPEHGTAWLRYENAMRQRTRLLEDGGDEAWLAGLESEMAGFGAALILNRYRLVHDLQALMDARPETPFPRASVTIVEADQSPAAEKACRIDVLAEALKEALRASRRRDGRAGRCLVGPHRTEIATTHRGKSLPASECSTGEQKALLVGLMLAHARIVAAASPQASTLVLIDEAVAHLDAERRACLAGELADMPAQSWLTGTDLSLFDTFGPSFSRFVVADGGVRPAEE
jgi:DNA replication and repair protein RecF